MADKDEKFLEKLVKTRLRRVTVFTVLWLGFCLALLNIYGLYYGKFNEAHASTGALLYPVFVILFLLTDYFIDKWKKWYCLNFIFVIIMAILCVIPYLLLYFSLY